MNRRVNGTLLDVKAAAAYLGGNERWLRRLLDRGVVPFKRIGRNIFFKKTELDDFVDSLPGISPREARRNRNRSNGDVTD